MYDKLLLQAFVEMRSKGSHTWRIGADKGGNLQISYIKQGKEAGETILDLESNGASHFRKPVIFYGKTLII